MWQTIIVGFFVENLFLAVLILLSIRFFRKKLKRKKYDIKLGEITISIDTYENNIFVEGVNILGVEYNLGLFGKIEKNIIEEFQEFNQHKKLKQRKLKDLS